MHHFVMDPRPHCSGPLYSSFASHADNAARPSSSSGLLKGVKGNKVHVRVVLVVSGLVMDRQDESRFAVSELLSKRICQRFSLCGGDLDGKRDDEAFSHSTLPSLRTVLCCLRSVPVSGLHAPSQNYPSSFRASNVAQMGRHLPRLCFPGCSFPFRRECLCRMPE